MSLETERLVLREFTGDDFAAVYEHRSDPEVVRYMVWEPNSDSDTLAFLDRARTQAAADPRVAYTLGVIEKDSGQLVGGIDLGRNGPDSHQGALGYCFAKSAWGRGIATESARRYFASASRNWTFTGSGPAATRRTLVLFECSRNSV